MEEVAAQELHALALGHVEQIRDWFIGILGQAFIDALQRRKRGWYVWGRRVNGGEGKQANEESKQTKATHLRYLIFDSFRNVDLLPSAHLDVHVVHCFCFLFNFMKVGLAVVVHAAELGVVLRSLWW